MPSISVVIPAYNEELRLPASLDAVWSYLYRQEWSPAEIIVVDDGSTDATQEVVRRFASQHPGVRLLENPGNRGKGYAVRHGVLAADSEWVLFSDADLSAPIEELDNLIRTAGEQQAEVVIGSRALNRSLIGAHQSGFREWAGRIFNLFMRLFTGLPFWDTQCGFKLFSARAASEVFRRQRLNSFGFDAEVLFIARTLRLPTVEVPVRWNHVEGTKVSMFRDSIGMFLDLARIRLHQFLGHYR